MSDAPLEIGMLVIHPKRPDWGPGKIVHIDREGVYVFWRDAPDNVVKKIVQSVVKLQPAGEQHDPVLDNLPPLVNKDGTFVKLPSRLTLKQAIEKFHTSFPLGFRDAAYIGSAVTGERQYKWDAHVACVERLGSGRFRQLLASDKAMLIAEVQRCYRSLNLLSLYEKSAFTDALANDVASTRFLTTLADVLDAADVSRSTFEPYLNAVAHLPAERGRVATWPVATIIPFLMQPDRHLFLKPEVTKKAADTLGFSLNYKTELNWLTYERLLAMGRLYKEQLVDLQPRDMIDVQSFFWVVGTYGQCSD